MKIAGKPLIEMECTLVMNQDELRLLHRLCSYGTAVVEPIIGKEPHPDLKREWETFLHSVRDASVNVLNKFYDADQVFQGKKRISS